jgi:hypothetical protein
MRTLTITCDCCGNLIKDEQVYTVEHYEHVPATTDFTKGHVKMVNGKIEKVSFRTTSKEFCLPCYNYLFGVFFDAMKAKLLEGKPDIYGRTPNETT